MTYRRGAFSAVVMVMAMMMMMMMTQVTSSAHLLMTKVQRPMIADNHGE